MTPYLCVGDLVKNAHDIIGVVVSNDGFNVVRDHLMCSIIYYDVHRKATQVISGWYADGSVEASLTIIEKAPWR